MIAPECSAAKNPDHVTSPRWRWLVRFRLRSLFVIVSICCILTFWALRYYEWAFPRRPASIRTKVTPVAVWRGTIPFPPAALPRIVVNQLAWDVCTKALYSTSSVPQIDFKETFVIISWTDYPDELTHKFHIDTNGDVHISTFHKHPRAFMTYGPPSEASFVVTVLPKKGIKSVGGIHIPP
jgi:hypothetical protein